MLRYMVIIVICAALTLAAFVPIGVVEGHRLNSDEIEGPEAQDTETVDIEQPHRQARVDFEKRVAEMWETGEFEMDHGGMIPLAVLKFAPKVSRIGGARYGPQPPDPLRRDVFDAWCGRIGISAVAPTELLEAIWTDYAERVNQILLTQYPPIYELSSSLAGGPRPLSRGDVRLLEEMIVMRERARSEVYKTEDRLFRMLSAIDQGQFAADVESWHLYRRWERAPAWTVPISGASIHLSRLLETHGIEWPNRHVHVAYDTEIAGAAERRELHHLRTVVRLAENQAAGYYDRFDERYERGSPESREALADYRRKSTPLRRQRWRRQRELYNINLRYITMLLLLLDRNEGEFVHDVFHRQAFPDHFPNEYDLRRWYDKVLEDPSIDGTLCRNIAKERDVYVGVQRSIDDSLIQTIHDHEADLIITRTRNPAKSAAQSREIDYELQRRYENAIQFAVRLVELLDGDERHAWVREELEELLETNLTRTW